MQLIKLLLPFCAAVFCTPQSWQRISPDLELTFPADHGAHPETRIEWWYLTGQASSEAGEQFGFQFTIFRRGLLPGPALPGESPLRARQVFAGHLALTDIASGRTLFAERLRRAGSPLASAGLDDLDLVLDDWSLVRGDGDRLRLAAGDVVEGISLQLELTPSKPLVLHGKRGYSSKGSEPGNASAYVSWPRLATSGEIKVGGRTLKVSGESWFDHEFGTSVLEKGVVGWDWFGLQLDDGRELMLFLLRRADGVPVAASAGTLVESDGRSRSLKAADFEITCTDTWKSPHSEAAYPSRWMISIPSAKLSFEVVPRVADSEVGATRSVGAAYWEGPVEVRGETKGRGYAELTGYAGSMEGRL